VSWRHRFEAWGAGVFFAAMRALPLDTASALGGALARAIGPCLGVSRRAMSDDDYRAFARKALEDYVEPTMDPGVREALEAYVARRKEAIGQGEP